MKILRVLFLFQLALISCQTKHLNVTHNTPYFTKGNQIEGCVNVGLSGAHANIAYTPIKYLALQANGLAFSKPISSSRYFNNYFEGAIGVYYPVNDVCFGTNIGYGLGSTNWTYDNMIGVSGYTMYEAKFDSKNAFFHFYLSHQQNNCSRINGLSFKTSFFNDTYSFANTGAGELKSDQILKNTQLLEFTCFLKERLAKHLYLHLNIGSRLVFNSQGDDRYFIARIGILFR